MTKTNHKPPENMNEGKERPTTSDEAVDRAAHGSASRDEEIKTLITRMTVARKAILEDLSRRHREGDKTVKMNGSSQSEYDDDGPRNYISGAGEIDCPVCKEAKLRYSRASYNGHVHAACMSDKCVRWME